MNNLCSCWYSTEGTRSLEESPQKRNNININIKLHLTISGLTFSYLQRFNTSNSFSHLIVSWISPAWHHNRHSEIHKVCVRGLNVWVTKWKAKLIKEFSGIVKYSSAAIIIFGFAMNNKSHESVKWCLKYAVNLPFLNYFKYAAQLTLAGAVDSPVKQEVQCGELTT